MFLFGHLGVGRALVWRRRADLPWISFSVGALLPDLIDKPVYYACVWVTGLRGAELGLISGTRTFAHTLVFLGFWVGLSRLLGGPRLRALAWGLATHLLLDLVQDLMGGFQAALENGIAVALLFPATGLRFPVSPHSGLAGHLFSLYSPQTLGVELIGLSVLVLEYRKRATSRSRPALRKAKSAQLRDE